MYICNEEIELPNHTWGINNVHWTTANAPGVCGTSFSKNSASTKSTSRMGRYIEIDRDDKYKMDVLSIEKNGLFLI